MNPPDLWGWTPVPCPTDHRWLAVKDEPVFVKVTPPGGEVHAIDQWVQHEVTYRSEQFDEWSPPQVTLERGYGDCEDLALLKRAVLLRLGFPEERIFFVLVRYLTRIHAVLIIDDQGWKCLDSFNGLTLPVEQVTDYTPVEAFCGDQAWLYGRKV